MTEMWNCWTSGEEDRRLKVLITSILSIIGWANQSHGAEDYHDCFFNEKTQIMADELDVSQMTISG